MTVLLGAIADDFTGATGRATPWCGAGCSMPDFFMRAFSVLPGEQARHIDCFVACGSSQ